MSTKPDEIELQRLADDGCPNVPEVPTPSGTAPPHDAVDGADGSTTPRAGGTAAGTLNRRDGDVDELAETLWGQVRIGGQS